MRAILIQMWCGRADRGTSAGSRMNREAHVRFRESRRARLPLATHPIGRHGGLVPGNGGDGSVGGAVAG
jgi:hypothetical protein